MYGFAAAIMKMQLPIRVNCAGWHLFQAPSRLDRLPKVLIGNQIYTIHIHSFVCGLQALIDKTSHLFSGSFRPYFYSGRSAVAERSKASVFLDRG